MRAGIILAAVLPFVVAHHAALEGRGLSHDLAERQGGLIGGLLGGDESSSSAAPSSSARTTTPAREPSSAADPTGPTSSRSSAVSSSVAPTSVSSASGASSISGSASRASSISGSVNATGSSNSSISATASVTGAQNVSTTVDSDGVTKFVTFTYTPPAQSAAVSSSTAPAASTTSPAEGPAISTPAIIGISVGVGAVVLSLIGCAIWRMKKRSADEDEAIRWPELNRHGDSDAHHALPARVTGGHGIETSPLERSLSNSSEMYMTQHSGPVTVPMALNGSNFGAASTLDYPSQGMAYEKDLPSHGAHGSHDYAQGAYGATTAAGYDYNYGGAYPAGHAHDQAYDHEDYSSYPPAVAPQLSPSQGGAGAGMYESDSEGEHGRMIAAGAGGAGGAANPPPSYRV